MKTVNINKISAIFLGIVLLSSVLSSAAYAGLPITDLSIEKTSDQTTAAPGDLWDFSVAVTNNSLDLAEFAEIVDPLGSNLEFIGASPDICSLAPPPINTLFCFLPTLSTGEEFNVDITVRIDPTTPLGTEIPNKASVFGDSSASTPDDEDEIFLMVGTEDPCICKNLSIKPRLINGANLAKFLNRAEVTDLGTDMKVLVLVPWAASILCSGGDGECEGRFLLSATHGDWRTNTLSTPRDAESVDAPGHFEIVKRNVIEEGPDDFEFSIECIEDCSSDQPSEKKVPTQFGAFVFIPNKGDTGFDVSGTINLQIVPINPVNGPPCEMSEGWEMILKINTMGKPTKQGTGDTKKRVIDVPNSDFDGDGRINMVEAGPDGEIGTKDDPKNADGVPHWLNPKIKA